MRVYGETNFAFEIALERKHAPSCESLVAIAAQRLIELAVPAFCFGEAYEACIRRQKPRVELEQRLAAELNELSRSKAYLAANSTFRPTMMLLDQSKLSEMTNVNATLKRLATATEVIPLTSEMILRGLSYQTTLDLSPQDALVLASVTVHLATSPTSEALFLTQNSKDFANPDVAAELARLSCKVLTNFRTAEAYVARKVCPTRPAPQSTP